MNNSTHITDRTLAFAVRVVKLAGMLDKQPGTPRTLANQLLRSDTSVGENVEEAQAGQNQADFVSKMSIALKEARETLYWLKLLIATEVCTTTQVNAQVNEMIQEANELVCILVTILKKTKENGA